METLQLDGRRIAYWASGEGTPLVFIHGVGTSGELWAGHLAPLAADCRLVVYDRRGYGASSASPRDWAAHRDDAAALMDALGAGPAVVVGYSGGAIIALDLALARPDLFRALVLLDPAFNLKRCLTFDAVRHLVGARVLARVRGERRGAEYWMRYVGSRPDAPSAFDRSTPERRERLLANASGVFADFASGTGDHVAEDRLATIAIPTTIADCALSPSFLRRSCERLRGLMPQARAVTFARSGHHVGVDAPDELLALLRETVAVHASAPA